MENIANKYLQNAS
ncbi:TPA_asm: hypothetical protein G3A00_10365 [Salmonella enterica subsp. diarizonae]|nr:hypothetical protein [Salmonella enterica subsp. enterica serovar Derby]MCD3078010.1 hypothetical protein [Salmonella enterica subsp. enterica serovar Enteritidis]HAE1474384.1 hypothetical protein [Salmonella enterica subsp. diarizonae]